MRLLLSIFFGLMVALTYGQMSSSVSASLTLPSVALLDIEPSGSVSLSLTSPSEAGNGLGSGSTNNSKWLNITSAVSSGLMRRITAHISGTAPTGVRLRVSSASVTGGAGTRGTPGSALFLTTSAQTLINGIGGGYTGTGTTNGFNLTYSLDIQSYNLIKSGVYNFSVIYTLADNP